MPNNTVVLNIQAADLMSEALTYVMDEAAKAELALAEAEALEAIAAHAATIRRLSADLRVAKGENARLRGILKIRGIRA